VGLTTKIKRETGIEAMAHFTCVGHSKDEIRNTLSAIEREGIENVLALRGDPPKGETAFTRAANGFGFASELVGFIRSCGFQFCVGSACYPEGHPESDSKKVDLEFLRAKVDAGAEF